MSARVGFRLCWRSVIFHSLLALLLLVAVFAVAYRSQGQSSTRVYSLHWQTDFSGANCAAGWEWSNPDGVSRVDCTGSTVRILQKGGQQCGQGILYRNDIFPATGNIAVEVRMRYEDYKGYGADTFDFYPTTYHGERYCHAGGSLYTDPSSRYCPAAPPQSHWRSHGAGNGTNRSVYSFDYEWSESPPQDKGCPTGSPCVWVIVRWEFDASQNRWFNPAES